MDNLINNGAVNKKGKDKNSNKFYYDGVLWAVEFMDTVLMTIPFGLCWILYYSAGVTSPYYSSGNWLVIVIFIFLFVLLGRVYDNFMISLYRVSEIVFSQCLAAFFADTVMYLIIVLLSRGFTAILPLMIVFIVQTALSVIWAAGIRWWFFNTFAPRRTLIVYDMREGLEEEVREYGLDKKFNIVRTISAEECLKEDLKQIDDMEAVFLCGVHSHDRNKILKRCITRNISVYMLPRIGDILVSSAKRMHMFNLPMLRVSRYFSSPVYVLCKRGSDIVLSLFALALLSPAMLAVSLAIKLWDGGPALYKQCRLTKNGRRFMLIKFRSMRVDAESNGVARISSGDDDERVTPVGRFLRRFRIDELPQFINILKGDMSLVGPRPERPEIACRYEEELPEFAMRLQVKAGLTGYAQVYGKYNTSPYDKLQMDLIYIARPSIWEDMVIILTTIKILFIKSSTDGVAEAQTAADESSK